MQNGKIDKDIQGDQERSFIQNIFGLPKKEPKSSMNLKMKQKTPTMKPFIGLSVQNKEESEMKNQQTY